MLHRMIENGAQLIVERFQIYGRVRLAVFVPVVQHFALPRHDLLGMDFAHFPLSEVRHQLFVEDMLFRPPGVFLDTAFHVRHIDSHEVFKGHFQVGGLLLQECPLPLQSLPLGGKAPFHFLYFLARPVLVVKGRIPCALCLVFVCRHCGSLLIVCPAAHRIFPRSSACLPVREW